MKNSETHPESYFTASGKIGLALETIREKKKLNKKDFAKEIGITATYYSAIIQNKVNPGMEVLERFCEELEIPLYHLIYLAMKLHEYNDKFKNRLINDIESLFSNLDTVSKNGYIFNNDYDKSDSLF